MTTTQAPGAPQAARPSGRDRAEWLILPANFVTYLGNGIQMMGASLLVLEEQRTALSVGWLFIVMAIPQVLLSVLFGRLVDRFDRRMMCLLCDVASALAALSLPVALALGASTQLTAYVVTFALSLISAAFNPASNALVRERVRYERLGPFNANFSMSTQAGSLLSAAVGGFLIQVFGLMPMFYFNAATFAFSAACWVVLGRKPQRSAEQAAEEGTQAGTPTGGPVKRLGVLLAVGSVNITVSNVLLVVLVIQVFKQHAGIFGLVDALAGVGMLIGAAVYKRISARVSNLALAAFGFAGNAALIAVEPFHIASLMTAIPFAAFAFGFAAISSRTLLMRAVEDSRSGRVFGTVNAVSLAAGLVVTITLSYLADHRSVALAFWSLSLLIGVVPLAAIATMRRFYAAQERTTAATTPVPQPAN
ncbi:MULTISPECIES: MFS transporter [unclassified Streptomyces]|uniref:MFS transporter n=1 Tax=unclassified Streptomyces TaxID=2593676 RepID=UPI00035F4B9D|nr:MULTISPECIES: MFS transporter [unclassified Streptomyces]MYT33730.1 MFS transporter [Streptomyces sp. SID8354]